jgi:peptidoglycan/LPS O-acetylase OafA/YrhL
LRFFAALHVFFFHLLAFKILWSQGWLRSLASIGYVGVSFFFVLSGFILVYTYAGRDAAPREFWRARFARVYPAFLFALLMTAPFFFYAVFKLDFPLFAWSARHLKLSVAMVLLLLQAWVPAGALAWNPVAWSLSDEAFFYAAFPFLLRKISKLGIAALALVAVTCWAASLGITWTYVLRNPDHLAVIDADVLSAFWLNAVKFLPLFRLPEFVIGMACGMLFLKSSKDSRLALPLILGGLIVSAFAALYSAKIPYPVLHTSLLANLGRHSGMEAAGFSRRCQLQHVSAAHRLYGTIFLHHDQLATPSVLWRRRPVLGDHCRCLRIGAPLHRRAGPPQIARKAPRIGGASDE